MDSNSQRFRISNAKEEVIDEIQKVVEVIKDVVLGPTLFYKLSIAIQQKFCSSNPTTNSETTNLIFFNKQQF